MLHLVIPWGFKKRIEEWVSSHYINLAIFNVLIVILVLLHSANYFYPFWTITINIIVLFSFIAAILLLGADSKILFLISLQFLALAGLMRVLGVNVWAERISIYVFESIAIGVFLLLTENIYVYTKTRKIWKNLKR